MRKKTSMWCTAVSLTHPLFELNLALTQLRYDFLGHETQVSASAERPMSAAAHWRGAQVKRPTQGSRFPGIPWSPVGRTCFGSQGRVNNV